MDGGCEYHGYASDITRTWPVNGTFTEPQRELYEVVLRVQKKCISVGGKAPLDSTGLLCCMEWGGVEFHVV